MDVSRAEKRVGATGFRVTSTSSARGRYFALGAVLERAVQGSVLRGGSAVLAGVAVLALAAPSAFGSVPGRNGDRSAGALLAIATDDGRSPRAPIADASFHPRGRSAVSYLA